MTNADEEELTHREQLAAILQRRRRVLEIQRARFGDSIPASILLELEDTEQQLAQVQADLRRLRPGRTEMHCPYVGLLTFQEHDSTLFFGRDALVGELLDKVDQTSFLAVLGPSGSGKSSVVRAGLVPALKKGALPGSDQWHYLVPLTPGARPLNALATVLGAAQNGILGNIASIRESLRQNDDALLLMADGLLTGRTNARVVLVVDQAEELWTLTPTEATARTAFEVEQQQPFITCLLTAAAALDKSVLIIFCMRADFLHRAIEHHDLARLLGEHDVMVSPLLLDELRSAITRPAELVGGVFEHGLVDTLIEQTAGRTGALPLLEYTLLELWKGRRADGTLTWEAFKHIGGVEGGLAQRADTILAQQYTPQQQVELRAILLRLVQPGEGAVDTRRRIPIDDLVPAGGSVEAVHALLKPLADERLLTTGHDPVSGKETAEISHEALIRAWPRLGAWISQARADLRFQLQMEEAAREWEVSGESVDFVWSGLRLANAEVWLDRTQSRLNARDQRFLDASRTQRQAQFEAEQARTAATEAARERELDQARTLAAGARRLKQRAMYLSIALVATVAASAIAGWFWYSASRGERRAFARYLATQAQEVYEDQPLLGMRLMIEGLAQIRPDDLEYTDLLSATVQMARQGRLYKFADDGYTIYPSPDGTVFILARTGPAYPLPGSGYPLPAQITPITVQTAAPEQTTAPDIIYYTNSGKVTPLSGQVRRVVFSPDSKVFVVSYANQRLQNELRRTDGGRITPLLDGNISHVVFSLDSKAYIVFYSSTKPLAELRYIDSDQIIQLSDVFDVSFTPDGKFFVAHHSDESIELRRTDDGQIVRLLDGLNDISFSPNYKFFVVRYKDRPGELRHLDNDQALLLTDRVFNIMFSSDSRSFVVDYGNGRRELRYTDSDRILPLSLSGVNDGLYSRGVSFSPSGKFLVIRYADTSIELRRTDNGQIIQPSNALEVSFSPDEKFVVVRYRDKQGELRQIDGGRVASLSGIVSGARFSPDGSNFLVFYYEKNIQAELRHIDGNQIIPLPSTAGEISFSSDSKFFMARYADGQIEFWDAQAGQRLLLFKSGLKDFFFELKAQHLVVIDFEYQVYLLDTAWLRSMAGYPKTVSEADLIKYICTGPLSSPWFDEKSVQSFLGNQAARGCR
jgi:WD40 repeat protein